MARTEHKASIGKKTLDIGSSFAAGALMLSHMNRSGLTRYDDLIADLNRLQYAPNHSTKRADRPHQRRAAWVTWLYGKD